MLCLPSDSMQHDLQRWSLISIPDIRKTRKYMVCRYIFYIVRISCWVLRSCRFTKPSRKCQYDPKHDMKARSDAFQDIIHWINRNKNDVEITKILLLVLGVYPWSGVCDKFTQLSTSDQLYSDINSAPLIVRVSSLSTVSSSSLSTKRVPTGTWPRSQVAGPPCLPLSVSHFLPPLMPNILLLYLIHAVLHCVQCAVVVCICVVTT